MKKYQRFLSENFQFLEVKFSVYLNRRVSVMLLETMKWANSANPAHLLNRIRSFSLRWYILQ